MNGSIDESLQQADEALARGALGEAEARCRALLAEFPLEAPAIHLLGVVAYRAGKPDVALELFRRAIAIDPGIAYFHSDIGEIHMEQGRLDQAIGCFRRAVELDPGFAEAHCNLGTALSRTGSAHDQAIAHLQTAIQLKPALPALHDRLCNALLAAGAFQKAVDAGRVAVKYAPDAAQYHNTLGNALSDACELDEAIAEYSRAIELGPNQAAPYTNLGNALNQTARHAESLSAYRRAVALAPDDPVVGSALLYMLHFYPDSTQQMLRDEHVRWRQRHADPLKCSLGLHANDPDPDRTLRVGYVSPDFYAQAESFFVLPFLQAHDHDNFEVHCYSSVRLPDVVTRMYRGLADVWHDVLPLSDKALAQQIIDDRIDILVDLTMHMRNNRMLLYARKPAPVQVTWLAYPGSTGLDAIDYRLTDAHMEPIGADESWSAEKPIRLPDSWCVYRPITDAPLASDPPMIRNGFLTFGSLNNFMKINESVLTRWARLLQAVDRSRLLLLCPAGESQRRIIDSFAARGISEDRLRLVAPQPRHVYMRLYSEMDLALDPFPYNGITTTCDALWMGVPVLTLPGSLPASRAGLSLLTTAGFDELIAESEEQFIETARAVARELPTRYPREHVRQKMSSSPLMDAPRFARNVEGAFRQMWQSWCRGRRS
jgi:predicted O-linked N-acetylglucosamine transferase (SPINDLY family)